VVLTAAGPGERVPIRALPQQDTVTVLTAHAGLAMAIQSVAIRKRTTMTSMPQPMGDDQDSNRAEEIILGADTHKDLHVAAVITSLGALRETKTFPASAAGYQALLSWAGTFGILRRAGVECTGSYGAALARHNRWSSSISTVPYSSVRRSGHRHLQRVR
jgi:hypothetical protein